MTAELESEVQRMCNLSTAIENQGIKKGRAEGRAEGVDLMAKLVKILIAEKNNHGDRNGGHLIGYGGLISVPVVQEVSVVTKQED